MTYVHSLSFGRTNRVAATGPNQWDSLHSRRRLARRALTPHEDFPSGGGQDVRITSTFFFPERGCTSKSIPPQVTPDQFSEPAGISIHLNMGIKEIVDHQGLAWARGELRETVHG